MLYSENSKTMIFRKESLITDPLMTADICNDYFTGIFDYLDHLFNFAK